MNKSIAANFIFPPNSKEKELKIPFGSAVFLTPNVVSFNMSKTTEA